MYAKVINVFVGLHVFVPVLGMIRVLTTKHSGDRIFEAIKFSVSFRMIRLDEVILNAQDSAVVLVELAFESPAVIVENLLLSTVLDDPVRIKRFGDVTYGFALHRTTSLSFLKRLAMTKMNRLPAFVFGIGPKRSTATDSKGFFVGNKCIGFSRRIRRRRFRA